MITKAIAPSMSMDRTAILSSMPDRPENLTPADPVDLAAALAFALRFDSRRRNHEATEIMARIVARAPGPDASWLARFQESAMTLHVDPRHSIARPTSAQDPVEERAGFFPVGMTMMGSPREARFSGRYVVVVVIAGPDGAIVNRASALTWIGGNPDPVVADHRRPRGAKPATVARARH